MINLTASPAIRGLDELDDASSELLPHPGTSARCRVLTYRLLFNTLVTHLYHHLTSARPLFREDFIRQLRGYMSSSASQTMTHFGCIEAGLCHDDTPAVRTSVWMDLTTHNLLFASLLNYAPANPIQLFSNGITEPLLLCDPVLAASSVSNGDSTAAKSHFL